MSDCPHLDCPTCHPPPPPESRPGWAQNEPGSRHWSRNIGGMYLAAMLPKPGEPGVQCFWCVHGAPGGGGYAPTLAEAQLACERAAVPILRAALATLEAEAAGPAIYCEHGVAADCAVHRTILPGPPGPMPVDGGVW